MSVRSAIDYPNLVPRIVLNDPLVNSKQIRAIIQLATSRRHCFCVATFIMTVPFPVDPSDLL